MENIPFGFASANLLAIIFKRSSNSVILLYRAERTTVWSKTAVASATFDEPTICLWGQLELGGWTMLALWDGGWARRGAEELKEFTFSSKKSPTARLTYTSDHSETESISWEEYVKMVYLQR